MLLWVRTRVGGKISGTAINRGREFYNVTSVIISTTMRFTKWILFPRNRKRCVLRQDGISDVEILRTISSSYFYPTTFAPTTTSCHTTQINLHKVTFFFLPPSLFIIYLLQQSSGIRILSLGDSGMSYKCEEPLWCNCRKTFQYSISPNKMQEENKEEI